MQTPRPALIVSLHDVSPLTRDRVSDMLSDLKDIGVSRTSLLVIPNHHHKALMLEDTGFCRWLGEVAAQGHEIVLHGYFHLRNKVEAASGRLPDDTKRPEAASTLGWWGRLITEHYTAGEGEFYDLSEMEAGWRLEKGLKEFAEAGVRPCGFIAPAWLLGENAERAVKNAGFGYTTRLQNFKDLSTGRETVSQSLVWSVRSAWRRWASLRWNALLARRLRANPLLRIGLHPPDWDHPAIKKQIMELTAAALAVREAITYEDWLARVRAQ